MKASEGSSSTGAWGFFRTRRGLGSARLAFSRLPSLIARDLGRNLANAAQSVGARRLAASLGAGVRGVVADSRARPAPAAPAQKPIIFASACASEVYHGGWKYNGGVKLLNNLVKLVRLHGYEAYMVTYDGTYEPWLIDHQPHLSIEAFRQKMRGAEDVRCLTSWAEGSAFISECRRLYFWDMELAWTEHSHFPALARLYLYEAQKNRGHLPHRARLAHGTLRKVLHHSAAADR